MKKCTRCKGDKKITGMGGMKEDCPSCKGKGFVANDDKKKKKSQSKE